MVSALALFCAVLSLVLAPPTRAAGDHLKCYKVKDSLAKAKYVGTIDGLTVETGCQIKVPGKLLCVSATKSGVTPPPPGGGGTGQPNDFVCYKVKCPKATLPPLAVSDQFGTRAVTPSTAKLLCAPIAGPPTACCAPVRITTTSGQGKLSIGTIPPFPLPAGVIVTMDAGPAGAFPNCAHPTVIPAGGFTVPTFCIPATGFTADVVAAGCASGGAAGRGTIWDGAATCPDADVSHVGDTSDADGGGPSCGTLGAACDTAAGNAGDDTKGNIDTTRGNGVCDGLGGVHTQLDIPVVTTVWVDNDYGCPDADGVYDPGTDTIVTQFTAILSPTTATSNADFADLNGDSCSFAGNGPDHTKHCSLDPARPCTSDGHCTFPAPAAGTCMDGPLTGSPALGPCCAVGQTTTLVASGVAFTGDGPFFDLTFASSIPTTVTSCGAFVPGSCTLTTDPCAD